MLTFIKDACRMHKINEFNQATCNMTPSGNRTRINENLYMLAARSSSRSRIALVFKI